MKKWPDEGPASFSDISDSAMEMMEALDVSDRGEDLPYEGLPLGKREQAIALSPGEILDPGDNDFLRDKMRAERSFDPRGRLRRLLSAAIQLGIEQGRRMRQAEDEEARFLREGAGRAAQRVSAGGGASMRYIVVLGHPIDAQDPCTMVDADRAVACEDALQVQAAIDSNRRHRGGDWAVFELAKGGFERRSVTFERDGKTILSIQ